MRMVFRLRSRWSPWGTSYPAIRRDALALATVLQKKALIALEILTSGEQPGNYIGLKANVRRIEDEANPQHAVPAQVVKGAVRVVSCQPAQPRELGGSHKFTRFGFALLQNEEKDERGVKQLREAGPRK